ncbi:FAD-dependent pyridine nucleotide-disulfide oxidoreductase [Penicillium canariense]|uniref:FAD-dependent pyridine nucleotide-disulfide oxidoreductase n=1 Tax=Penicillium canariense TaxID=189055 RepID=A0A9W9I2X2_9EURO|nr:FAD-dependent pyridine nucleotide-disulfide oxidoreductase [Penicillium canariense]KAJ5166935.1 FAD-dependent pyridine nucleotide-disulfide oxidoreductase [Penicillium canariense]
MRTNLSRFTVAFSDLSWESALGDDADIPMFPQARQVGQYLATYSNRYIPQDVMRLGHRVVKTERSVGTDTASRWRVSWIGESVQNATHESAPQPDKMESEDFDLLVVASGYFSRPYIPALSGLDQFTGRVIHSSALEKGRSSLDNTDTPTRGNTVVIGGSMSGVESASALALQKASSCISADPTPYSPPKHKVHHIHSRPFWTLPTYLPCETSEDNVSFLPLDLAMYDLGRRPPGPIEYALGPISDEKTAKTNSYFSSLLGAEYENFGHMPPKSPSGETNCQPSWVAIGNDYAEFIRSGMIEATMGRVVSVNPSSDAGVASINIETPNGPKTLEDVTSIVVATGFTPFDSLSFLPDDVLSSLEYTATDPFLPLILDKGGTLRSEIPDLGFVGFYRGPYWGVMEMQARLLGKEWVGQHNDFSGTEDQRENLRILRNPSAEIRRGQFPMGDYVGLMEAFAKDLNVGRTALSVGDSRSGPVLPARYACGKQEPEVQRTLDTLRAMSLQDHPTAQAAAALAVFRALHGTWKFIQTSATGEKEGSGTVAFIPRYPSDSYDREYVLQEHRDTPLIESQALSHETVISIFRLSESGTSDSNSRIEIWSANNDASIAADRLSCSLRLTPPFRHKEGMGEYVINAHSIHPNTDHESTENAAQFTFHFQGVSITEWECVDLGDNNEYQKNAESRPLPRQRTVYKR